MNPALHRAFALTHARNIRSIGAWQSQPELPYETQCVSEHLTRSLVALEESFEDAMLSAQNTGRDVEALVRSQTAFVESKTADCEIEVTLSYHDFDENEAYQKCVFDYTNQRNKFLFFYSHYY